MTTLSSVDIVLAILVPFLIIICINFSISVKLSGFAYFYRHKQLIPSATHSAVSQTTSNRSPGLVTIQDSKLNRFVTRSDLSLNNDQPHKIQHTASTSNLTVDHRTNNNNKTTEPLLSGPKHQEKRPNSPLKQNPLSSSSILGRMGSSQVFVMSSNQNHQRCKSYSRTTRILIIISITYFILNSLMAYTKLRHLFEAYKEAPKDETLGHQQHSTISNYSDDLLNNELLERVSCYLYYLNFSINFFLYVLNKSTFRDILFGLFFNRSKTMNNERNKFIRS